MVWFSALAPHTGPALKVPTQVQSGFVGPIVPAWALPIKKLVDKNNKPTIFHEKLLFNIIITSS